MPLNGSNSESTIPEADIHDVYQENSLDGTFVIDLGDALDSITSLGLGEITDPKDLEAIENRVVEAEGYDEEAMQEEGGTSEEEDELLVEEEEQTYDPNDF